MKGQPVSYTGHGRKRAVRVLKRLMDTFEFHNIKCFADYGTLLGIIRHKGVIPWDKDFDISIINDGSDFPGRFNDCMKDLKAKGFSLRYKPSAKGKGLLMWEDGTKARHGGVNIDVFTWHLIDGEYRRLRYAQCDANHNKGRVIKPEWIESLTVGKMEGEEIIIPCEPEQLLAHRYGEDWRTPVNQNEHHRALRSVFNRYMRTHKSAPTCVSCEAKRTCVDCERCKEGNTCEE